MELDNVCQKLDKIGIEYAKAGVISRPSTHIVRFGKTTEGNYNWEIRIRTTVGAQNSYWITGVGRSFNIHLKRAQWLESKYNVAIKNKNTDGVHVFDATGMSALLATVQVCENVRKKKLERNNV
jgi:hypothetical protein